MLFLSLHSLEAPLYLTLQYLSKLDFNSKLVLRKVYVYQPVFLNVLSHYFGVFKKFIFGTLKKACLWQKEL